MKVQSIVIGFVLGAVSAGLVSTAISQDSKMPSPEDMEKGMQAWMDAMTPGEEHTQMLKAVGEWDTVTRIWMMGPDAPPSESKGTAQNKSVLGGRFMLETMSYSIPMPDMKTGEVHNMPVEGMGMFGYDRYQKMYIGCWADTMGTQLLNMRGNMSPDGKTLTMYGEMDEPMLGIRGRMVKYVTEHTDNDHITFSVYDLAAGDHFKVVEVLYTRKK